MQTVKEKGRGTLGIVASVALHVLFFAGCLALDTSDISSSNDKTDDITKVTQVVNTKALAQTKS